MTQRTFIWNEMLTPEWSWPRLRARGARTCRMRNRTRPTVARSSAVCYWAVAG
jgi:hypothetical protein